MRRKSIGLHFILAQLPYAAKCRIAQTLGSTNCTPCTHQFASVKLCKPQCKHCVTFFTLAKPESSHMLHSLPCQRSPTAHVSKVRFGRHWSCASLITVAIPSLPRATRHAQKCWSVVWCKASSSLALRACGIAAGQFAGRCTKAQRRFPRLATLRRLPSPSFRTRINCTLCFQHLNGVQLPYSATYIGQNRAA